MCELPQLFSYSLSCLHQLPKRPQITNLSKIYPFLNCFYLKRRVFTLSNKTHSQALFEISTRVSQTLIHPYFLFSPKSARWLLFQHTTKQLAYDIKNKRSPMALHLL